MVVNLVDKYLSSSSSLSSCPFGQMSRCVFESLSPVYTYMEIETQYNIIYMETCMYDI